MSHGKTTAVESSALYEAAQDEDAVMAGMLPKRAWGKKPTV
jgi:hypothetical protein